MASTHTVLTSFLPVSSLWSHITVLNQDRKVAGKSLWGQLSISFCVHRPGSQKFLTLELWASFEVREGRTLGFYGRVPVSSTFSRVVHRNDKGLMKRPKFLSSIPHCFPAISAGSQCSFRAEFCCVSAVVTCELQGPWMASLCFSLPKSQAKWVFFPIFI